MAGASHQARLLWAEAQDVRSGLGGEVCGETPDADHSQRGSHWYTSEEKKTILIMQRF